MIGVRLVHWMMGWMRSWREGFLQGILLRLQERGMLFCFSIPITVSIGISIVQQLTKTSGSGKTQFLLTLLLAVQLPSPKGLEKRAIYLSTEAPLSTQRLSQLLKYHPYLSKLPASKTPNLTNILSINAMDLESQDHILNYQLPVAIKRYNVGLVIIDSITSNYRAEHPSSTMGALSSRSGELAKLGQMLRNLAATENLAVIVANQVSDRFTDAIDHAPHSSLRAPQESAASSPAQRNLAADETAPLSSQAIPSSPFVDDDQGIEGDPARNETLSLLHQQRFFTGWGDTMEDLYETGYDQKSALKTPALGLVWSSQIACRIALKKEESPHFDGEVASTLEKGSWAVSQVSKEAEGDKKEVNESIISTGETGSGDPVPPISEATGKVTRRTMKLVMAPWTAGAGTGTENPSDGVDFVIGKGGFSSTRHDR